MPTYVQRQETHGPVAPDIGTLPPVAASSVPAATTPAMPTGASMVAPAGVAPAATSVPAATTPAAPTATTPTGQFGQDPRRAERVAADWRHTQESGTLTSIVNQRSRRFDRYITPLINDGIAQLNSTEMVDEAKKLNDASYSGVQGQMERQASRRGLALTPTQMRAFSKNMNADKTLSGINNVSNARTAQADRKVNNLAFMSNAAQGISSTGLSGLANAGSRDANRKSQDAANKTARQGQIVQGVGTAVGAYMMYAAMAAG